MRFFKNNPVQIPDILYIYVSFMVILFMVIFMVLMQGTLLLEQYYECNMQQIIHFSDMPLLLNLIMANFPFAQFQEEIFATLAQ